MSMIIPAATKVTEERKIRIILVSTWGLKDWCSKSLTGGSIFICTADPEPRE